MTTTSDTTLIGMGGSNYATESIEGAVPFQRVRDLFDFTVGHAPVFTMRGGVPTEVAGKHAVVRTDNEAVLNVTSKRYGIHQFSEVLVDNLLTLTDSSDHELQVASAGLLKGGAVGWVQVQAPMLRVSGGDDIAPTITLASSHDGSLATSYRTGMYRFACSNQLPALRKGGANVYKIKHTLRSRMRFEEARTVLGLMWDTTNEFQAEVERLIDTTCTDAQFTDIVTRLMPRPGPDASPSAMTRWENRFDGIRRLWTEDERVAPYRGTAWGATQAFSTWRQWDRPMRTTEANGASTRAGRVMSDFLAGRIDSDDRKAERAIREVVVLGV